MSNERDVFADLDAEQSRLEVMLEELPEPGWNAASLCSGWSVKDVVLHLAQTEEAVVTAASGGDVAGLQTSEVGAVEAVVDEWVRNERDLPPREVFARWQAARRAALAALVAADPRAALPWVAAPLKPMTLATTRLSEHWIHALDIAVPLEIPYPDDDRLWHVARLAHRTLSYAFAGVGKEAPATRFELLAPSGTTWIFGAASADNVVRGEAGALCRVAARRMDPKYAGLHTTGPDATEVLRLIRTYA